MSYGSRYSDPIELRRDALGCALDLHRPGNANVNGTPGPKLARARTAVVLEAAKAFEAYLSSGEVPEVEAEAKAESGG